MGVPEWAADGPDSALRFDVFLTAFADDFFGRVETRRGAFPPFDSEVPVGISTATSLCFSTVLVFLATAVLDGFIGLALAGRLASGFCSVHWH